MGIHGRMAEGGSEGMKNGLNVLPGECFTLRSGERMRVKKVEYSIALLEDLETGKTFAYGADALKHVYLDDGGSEE